MFAEVQPQQNVGRQGADIKAGQVVVRRRRHVELEPRGCTGRRRNRAGVECLPCGLASKFSLPGMKWWCPGTPLEPGQIYDINRFTLCGGRLRKRRYSGRLSPCARHARRARLRRSTI